MNRQTQLASPAREPGETEEAYEAFRTYASLPEAERTDDTAVEAAHDARCKAEIRSAGCDDPGFGELCDEALHGEGVVTVDLRPAEPQSDPHHERLPEDCTLAVRIGGGVLIGPSWAVAWALRQSGLYDDEGEGAGTPAPKA